MGRTARAVLVAVVAVFAAVAGLAAFLGFDVRDALGAGAVAGLASGALIHLAARRAETFHHPDDDRA